MTKDQLVRIGAHMSSAGDFPRAAGNAAAQGLNCVQYFSRNPRGGRMRRLKGREIDRWREKRNEIDLDPVVLHAPYSVNLASAREDVVQFSRDVVAGDLDRCLLLDVPYLVMHPGTCGDQGTERGIELVAEGLDRALSRASKARDGGVMVLLELMSGRGNEVGSTLEEMAAIIAQTKSPDSVGICMDTCHCFVRGYAVDEASGLDCFLEGFDRALGLDRLRVIHLNDSVHERGSRKDRHAQLGTGQIGETALKRIVNCERLAHLPFIMEVPVKTDDEYAEQANQVRCWRAEAPKVDLGHVKL